jgi:hypothetical protein
MNKGYISTSNIELGFILIEFHSFGEFIFLQGVIRKKERDMKDDGKISNYKPTPTQEDSRRLKREI